ncbi:MAG: hypothetical protein ABJF10_25730 [Chthoniobacter sp.]|uniref:hypothetical protein n=1 Tax=Chthoniobacter sp. TaxID=2510640 RepID=UPI0032A29D58
MTITDATPAGERLHSFTLDHLTERMTVREIIRARIWQEVADYNQSPAEIFRGLVAPGEAERTLNGWKMPKKRRRVDWEAQFQSACTAFERNGFFLLVGDRQAESLDEEFSVDLETEVQFVKLTPLVGG